MYHMQQIRFSSQSNSIWLRVIFYLNTYRNFRFIISMEPSFILHGHFSSIPLGKVGVVWKGKKRCEKWVESKGLANKHWHQEKVLCRSPSEVMEIKLTKNSSKGSVTQKKTRTHILSLFCVDWSNVFSPSCDGWFAYRFEVIVVEIKDSFAIIVCIKHVVHGLE